jgi:hypothetical protein
MNPEQDKNVTTNKSDATLNPGRLLMLGLNFWGAKAFLSAVELGVFTELARKPADGAPLSKKLGLHPRSSRDFLDTLVSLGVLERDEHVYSNASDANFFLDSAKPSYVGGHFDR